MKSDKESFITLMGLLIYGCITRELEKTEDDIDRNLLLICDQLIEVLYPSEPLTDEEVSKHVQAIKEKCK